MNIIRLHIILLLLPLQLLSQQYFPYHENGKMGIIDSTSKVVIEPMYSIIEYASEDRFFAYKDFKWNYINQQGELILSETFDYLDIINKNYAAVKNHNKVGVINLANDQVIIPCTKYDHISFSLCSFEAINNGFVDYLNKKGELFLAGKKRCKITKSIINDSLFIISNGKQEGLISYYSKKVTWHDNIELYPSFYIGETKKQKGVYHIDGSKITNDSIYSVTNSVINNIVHYIITTKSTITIAPENSNQVIVIDSTEKIRFLNDSIILTYRNKKVGLNHLKNLTKRITPQYNSILYENNLFIAKRNDSTFVYNPSLELTSKFKGYIDGLISPEISYIYHNNKTGVINLARNTLIIPTIYDYIDYKQFEIFEVSKNNLFGMMSPDGKVIIPCIYTSIEILEDKYKCYKENGSIAVYFTDSKGNIESSSTFNNVISGNVNIRQRVKGEKLTNQTRRARRRNQTEVFTSRYKTKLMDSVLYKLGWYKVTPDSITSFFDIKWGFKDSTKNIRLKPSSIKDVYLLDSNTSILYKHRKIRTKVKGQPDVVENYMETQFFNHKKYRFLPLRLNTISKDDIVNKKDRILGFKDDTYRIIDRQKLRVIDKFSCFTKKDQFNYVNKKGYIRNIIKREEEISNFNLPLYINHLYLMDSINTNYFRGFKYPLWKYNPLMFTKEQGKWGVYDTLWNNLIPVKYDFIHPYKADVFIVEDKKKRGLLSLDSVIFPIENIKLNRLKNYDSLFVFGVSNSNYTLIDDFGRPIKKDDDIRDYQALFEHFILIKKASGYGILNYQTKQEVLVGIYSRIKHLGNGMFLTKKKKNTGLVDTSGSFLITPQKYKKIIPLNQTMFMVKNNKKWGLMNNLNDTLLDFKYTNIKHIGDYIIGFQNKQAFVFDSKFNKILKKGINLLFLNNSYIVSSINSNVQLLDLTTKKKTKHKFDDVLGLVDDYLIIKKNKAFFKYYIPNDSLAPDTIKSLKKIDIINEKIVLVKGLKKWGMYDGDLKKINEDLFRNYSIKFNKFFVYYTNNGLNVYDITKNTRIVFPKSIKALQQYKDGIFTCQEYSGNIRYVDTSGNIILSESFKNGNTFIGNNVLVRNQFGKYQILNKQGGVIKEFKQYDKITQIAPHVFKTNNSILYGIVNNKGKVILPAIYHRINHVKSNSWLQLYKKNELNYFNLNSQNFLMN